MDSVRTEGSLLASLSELRAIEHQRLAEERAATEAALQAKRDQRAAAERIARQTEAARIADERNAQLAAEQARAEAERQVRMHVEAMEAAERARHMIALEERRFAEELALRREVAKRQRPRWMIVLTGVAAVAALGLGGFALERQHESALAGQARQRARQAQAQAEAAAHQAQVELDKLDHEVQDLEVKVGAAINRVRIAEDHATRQAAEDSLRELKHHEAEIQEQQRQRAEERKRKEREAGVVISADCLHNAVCK